MSDRLLRTPVGQAALRNAAPSRGSRSATSPPKSATLSLVGRRVAVSVRKALALLVVLALLLTACGGSDEGAEDGPLRLTFNGESCTYEGPTELTAGPAALIYLNESEAAAAVNLVILDEGKTVQDIIDNLGPEPATGHHPSWSHELGTWRRVAAGESQHWEGDLEPGIHAMVCASLSPYGVWFGTGLTVED